MDDRFTASTIDNSAIFIVIDQLIPYLKYKSDSKCRILDDEKATEKHRMFYEHVFLPYTEQSREHFYCHHNDAPSDSWQGEQVCLSMIHAINQKAWWWLYYYAIQEAIETHCKVSKDKIEKFAHKATVFMLDGDSNIGEAVNSSISKELDLEKHIEDVIVDDITNVIMEYKKAPSYPMVYR